MSRTWLGLGLTLGSGLGLGLAGGEMHADGVDGVAHLEQCGEGVGVRCRPQTKATLHLEEHRLRHLVRLRVRAGLRVMV